MAGPAENDPQQQQQEAYKAVADDGNEGPLGDGCPHDRRHPQVSADSGAASMARPMPRHNSGVADFPRRLSGGGDATCSPEPELSPVRARGRVRGSGMLSADCDSKACGRGAAGGGQGRRPLPGPSPWAAQPPPAAPAGARPGRPLPRAVCGERAPPPPGAAPPPRPGPLARSLGGARAAAAGASRSSAGLG